MIHLSLEQMLLVAGLNRRRFRDRTTEFVLASFPVSCAGLGRQRVAELVARYEETGLACGICGKRELSRYICYHFLLQENFEICPQTWIAGIVSSQGSGMTRMRHLDRAVDQLLEVQCGSPATT